MSLEIASIPLAGAAGALSILSPCVWPLVPVVMTSAATTGRQGAIYLALGLSASFAIAGTLLSFVLIALGLDPELFRYVAASLLLLVGATLLFKSLGDWLTLRLSLLTSRFNGGNGQTNTAFGQFGVGVLLGLVWLPCVGPTLGAAIALASLGQNMGVAFLIMLAFGIGTAAVLLVTGLASGKLLQRMRPDVLQNAVRGKVLLGWLLLGLGLLVLTGADKWLEAVALRMLPDWAVAF
ncbi:MAG: cytochrome C biogenesis protein [Betaproteobacteria bacterium HGW-Betaproteobacteria-22]|nr:MAG: cytochrome C biogenesis protein [Betaproteobacteria bacterium HGW-Betaproteobacteria-22]